MRELVDGLLKHSREFNELWTPHEVAVRRTQCKTFLTRFGPIASNCEVLATADGQQLVVLTPPAGTSSMDKLRLLAVVGASPWKVDPINPRQPIGAVPSISAAIVAAVPLFCRSITTLWHKRLSGDRPR